MSLTSKGIFPAKYILSNENISAIICKILNWPVKAIVTVDMPRLLKQTDLMVCMEMLMFVKGHVTVICI